MGLAIKKATDHLPVYFKLQQALLKKIESGFWEAGDAIPPERKLAEEHRVSIGTVKKAVLNLVGDGYLYRVQGRGTFVAGTIIRRESLRYYRFLPDFQGREADLEMCLISLSRVEASAEEAKRLKTRTGQELWRLERLFKSKDKPLIYTVSLLPVRMMPGLDNFPEAKWEKQTLYEAVEENFGLTTVFNREIFSATGAAGQAAKVLEIPEGSPVLVIDMLAYTYREKPYEYRRSWCLTDTSGVFREH